MPEGGRKRRSKERTEMMSAGSHSIGEDEGSESSTNGRPEERSGAVAGRLNRELVSRWILIMSPEKRREERRARSNREFESGARSRILTEDGGQPTGSLTLHSPSLHSIMIQSRTH